MHIPTVFWIEGRITSISYIAFIMLHTSTQVPVPEPSTFEVEIDIVIVLYNIVIEFRIPTELVRLIKMCLNEICSKIRVGINPRHFLFRMVWNKEMLYRHCFSSLLWNVSSRKFKEMRNDWNYVEHTSCWSVLTMLIGGCIQKFPDWVDTEIYA